MMERKEEPGHARRHRARRKGRSPAVESFRGEQPEHNNESRADPHQAQDDVRESECRHSCSWMIQPTEKIQSAASKRNFQVRFLALRPLQKAALPAAVYAMIVGAGFGEETVFRGYLFERFGKLFGSGVFL